MKIDDVYTMSTHLKKQFYAINQEAIKGRVCASSSPANDSFFFSIVLQKE